MTRYLEDERPISRTETMVWVERAYRPFGLLAKKAGEAVADQFGTKPPKNLIERLAEQIADVAWDEAELRGDDFEEWSGGNSLYQALTEDAQAGYAAAFKKEAA